MTSAVIRNDVMDDSPYPLGSLSPFDNRHHSKMAAEAPYVIVVTEHEVIRARDGDLLPVGESAVHGAFVGTKCRRCGAQFLAEMESVGSEGHRRSDTVETLTHYASLYQCQGCEAGVGCHFVDSEYPDLVHTAYDIEGEEDGDPVSIPGVSSLLDVIEAAQPFSWRLKEDLHEAYDWLEAVGGMAPNLVAGVKALRRAMERSILVLGSFMPPQRAELQRIQDHLHGIGREGILVDEVARIKGDAVRDKSRRMANLCNGIIVHDSIPAGHLNEVEMLMNKGRPMAIVHEGSHPSTLMLDGTEGDAVKFFPVTTSLEHAVDQGLQWIDSYIHNREIKVAKP